MQVPFVGFQPIRTSEHMAAAGLCSRLFACKQLNLIFQVLIVANGFASAMSISFTHEQYFFFAF